MLAPEAAAHLAAARAAIDEAGRCPTDEVATLSGLFPYWPDDVQREAFLHHAEGRDVVCCMPTGSGKTAVGTFAVWRALLHNRRAFYTTPLKALSAQKWRELSRIFGDSAVGLVTGDHCAIPDAPIVVMTTEILRNALYSSQASPTALEESLPRNRLRLDLLQAVILDELHWISDPVRGTAWEEVIIHCPRTVSIVGLSATVGGNAERFCEWVTEARARGPGCAFVSSSVRPVPLHYYVAGGSCDPPGLRHLSESTETSQASVHKDGMPEPPVDADAEATENAEDDTPPRNTPRTVAAKDPSWLAPRTPRSTKAASPSDHKSRPMLRSPARPGNARLARVLDLSRMLRRLQRLQWLPAIHFVMSRRGCDSLVEDFALSLGLPRWRSCLLVTPGERDAIEVRLEAFAEAHPEVQISTIERRALLGGVAAHHAGHLPAQRALVERLFELSLVKVVFATETLAAGVNMPARCVVLGSHAKYDGYALRPLNGSELMQMAGRAGRRGLDASGHAVLASTLPVSKVSAWAAATLAAGPEPLKSNFKPSYAMLCGLLQTLSLEQLRDVVNKSFGAFLMSRRRLTEAPRAMEEDPQGGNVESRMADASELRDIRALFDRSGFSDASIETYTELCDERARQTELKTRLSGRFFGHSDDDDLDDIFGVSSDLDDEAGETVEVPDESLPDITDHEVHASPMRDDLVSAVKRRRVLRRQLQRKEPRPVTVASGSAHHGWPSFKRYIDVLADVGFVAVPDSPDARHIVVTPAGAAASQISAGANAIWLGRLLLPRPLGADAIGAFGLDAASIAALVAGLVADPPVGPGSNSRTGSQYDAEDVNASLVPEPLRKVVAWACNERWRLVEIQWSRGVGDPMPLALDALVLVFRWASQEDWNSLKAEAAARGLDDGGLFRCLRRTVEVLRTFGSVVGELEGCEPWRDTVGLALDAVDRSPLADNLALDSGELLLDLGLRK